MKLKEKLAREHALSEGDNGNAELSYLAGFEKAREMSNEKCLLAEEDNNWVWLQMNIHYLGEEEVND